MVLAAFVLFAPRGSFAATCNFNSTVDNNFNDVANWTDCGGLVPGVADTILIGNGTTTSLSAPKTVAAMYASGTLNTLTSAFTVSGITDIQSGGAVSSTTGVITLSGAVTSVGLIGTDTGGGVIFGSTLANNPGGILYVGAGTVTTTGILTNMGTINGGSGLLDLGANYTDVAGTFNRGTGTVRFFGGDPQTIAPGATTYFNNLASMKTGGIATISVSTTVMGTLVMSGAGTILFDTAIPGALTIVGEATIGETSVVTTTNDTLVFTDAVTNLGSIGIGAMGGVITFSSTLDNTSGVLDVGLGSVNMNGAISGTGGVVNIGTGDLYLRETGTPALGTLNALVDATGGRVSFQGTGAQVIQTQTYNKISIGNTAGVTLGGNVTTTDDVTVVSGTLNLGGYDLNVLGDISVDSGATSFIQGASSVTSTNVTKADGPSWTVTDGSRLSLSGNLVVGSGTFNPPTFLRLTGTSAQTLPASVTTYQGLELWKTADGVVNLGADTTFAFVSSTGGLLNATTHALTVSGMTDLTGGAVSSTTGVITFTGAVTSAGLIGTDTGGGIVYSDTLANNGTLYVGGGNVTTTLALTGSGTIDGGSATGKLHILQTGSTPAFALVPGSGTVDFNGDGAQTIPAITYKNLTVSSTATLATGETIVNSNVTVRAGTLATGGNNLNVAGVLSVNGGATFAQAAAQVTSTSVMLDPGSFWTVSPDSRLSISGALLTTGATFAPPTYLRLTGGTAQALPVVVYNTLELWKTADGVVTLGGDTTIGSVSSTGGTLAAAGNALTIGTADLNGGAVSSTIGTITFTGPVTVETPGMIGTTVMGSILFSNTLNNGGTLYVGGGTVTSTLAVINTGIINVGTGIWDLAAGLSGAGIVTPGTGTIRLVGTGSPTVTFGGESVWNLQNLKTTGVATLATTTVSNDYTSTGAGIVSSGESNFTVTGVTTVEAGVVTSTSGTLTFNGSVSSTGSIGTVDGEIVLGNAITDTFQNNGTLDISGGTVTSTAQVINAGTIYGRTGTWDINGDTFTNTGTFTKGTGTVRLTRTGAQTIAGTTWYNLKNLKASGVATLGTTIVDGAFTSTGAGTISSAASSFTVTGLTTIEAGVVTSTSGALTFNGNVTSTGSIGTGSGPIVIGDATTDTFQNNGTLDLGVGSTVATTTAQVTNAGTIYGRAVTWVIQEDLISTGTIVEGTGTAKFTGSVAQVLTLPTADPTLYNVTVNKSALGLTLGSNVSSTNVVTVTAGTLSLGAYTLDLVGTGTPLVIVGTFTPSIGTVRYSGASATNITPTTYYNLRTDGAATYSLTANTTSTNVMTIGSAATFRPWGYTLDLSGSATPLVISGAFTAGTSTVRYLSNSATSLAADVYYALTLGGTATYTITASTTAMSTVTIPTSATLAVGAYDLTIPNTITNSGLMTRTTGSIKHPVDYTRVTDSIGTVVTGITNPGSLYLTVYDQNRNMDGATIETMTIPFQTALGADSETLTLTETSANSGIFRNAAAMTVRSHGAEPTNGYIDLVQSILGTGSYTDNQDSSDTGSTTVNFTFAADTAGGPTVGGGGGGGGSGSSIAYVLPSTAPVTPATTPVAPVVPPAVIPPVVIPPALPTVPVSSVRLTTPAPWNVTIGEAIKFSYAFTNATKKTANVVITRTVVNKAGKVIRTSRATGSVKAGKAWAKNVNEALLSTMKAGNYTIKVRITDAKTGKLIAENAKTLTVKAKPVKAPAKKK